MTMRKILMAGIAMMTIAISSCDEDTAEMGTTLINGVDQFNVIPDTFDVQTRSIIADSVLSRSSYSYLGRIKDPETGSYITSDYMTQFSILESEANSIFVDKSKVLSLDTDNQPIADSCTIDIVISDYMGDSLAAMKMRVTELVRPMKENVLYYTNYNPEKEGYMRHDGIQKKKMFSIADLTQNDSVRASRQSMSYYEHITIPLNEPYTDKQGNTYNNYGTYLLRTYYQHPEYFKNSATFTQNVCPGFYFKTEDGLGVMAEIDRTMLQVHYRHKVDTVVYVDTKNFIGTAEVLKTSHFTNDSKMIKQLAENKSCTYLKAPDGIFTEVTLPIDDIKRGHENDTIASAKIVFRRMNEISDLSQGMLQEPENLLMIERDSLFSFFEHRNIPDNITSYLATYSSKYNTYTFSNISDIINHMHANRNKSENWNKVVLVPVQVTTAQASTNYSSSSVIAAVNNELRITSVRLVGGEQNQHEPIRISVVYNKNE
jgi:hypothetical protein